MMNTSKFFLIGCFGCMFSACSWQTEEPKAYLQPVPSQHVKISDPLWSSIMERTVRVTIPDVLNKFEGWTPATDASASFFNEEQNALNNFCYVAEGGAQEHKHIGPPWYDGLVYETITGVSDHLLQHPDASLEARIDHYIDLIVKAQAADTTGYLNTYTTLEEPEHRWGENGGNLRWQHDVYNSGCLVEAAVHYYKATGKVVLLQAATRLANYMYRYMVEEGHNVVPGHALPEMALIELYRLYRDEPGLKQLVSEPVEPEHYLALATYWIEQRGHTEGRRPLFAYAQDSLPVLQTSTLEGHAVRATLMAAGLAMTAVENQRVDFRQTAERLWENMTGRRIFITGGVGAIHEDEKFGPDYYLPNEAYLETCAAVGAGLFSWQMNLLTADSRYMDVLERVLYNSLLTAVSEEGNTYTYQNPLNADNVSRWPWHGCPCCPPMYLKMTGLFPSMIYAYRGADLYINLLVGSQAEFDLPNVGRVSVRQDVDWKTGKVSIQVQPERRGERLRVHVRVPSWARGEELPLGLYSNQLTTPNLPELTDGYAVYEQGAYQSISLQLNIEPRRVTADSHIEALRGKSCLAAGPFIYCVEQVDRPELDRPLTQQAVDTWQLSTEASPFPLLPVINVEKESWKAIPYFLLGNRSPRTSYRVWLDWEGANT